MMIDFELKINQRGTCDEKHDQMEAHFGRDDLIPMWVAETDFSTADEIKSALIQRVEHGIFGYSYHSDALYHSIIHWYKEQHQVELVKENIFFDVGVLKALYEMIQIFTNEGDCILTHTPVYPQFEKVIKHTKRVLVTNQLKVVNHRFEIDFESFEEQLKQARMFILCSPHNPAGMVWSEADLRKMIQLCHQYHVVVISDEIHSDLVLPHQSFLSALAISNRVVVLNSPSKTFNLAGLQMNMTMTKDCEYMQLIQNHLDTHRIHSENTLSMIAMHAAYSSASYYKDAVVEKIQENYDLIKQMLVESKCQVDIYDLEASYLVWMDFSAYFSTYEELFDFFIHQCKVAVTFGKDFGGNSELFIRLNIATQSSTCIEVINRILEHLKDYS